MRIKPKINKRVFCIKKSYMNFFTRKWNKSKIIPFINKDLFSFK